MPLHTWLLLAHASTVPVSSDSRAPDTGYIVHEWGTFTAVAGADGQAVMWRPLAGPSDLPDFVYTTDKPDGLRTSARATKSMTATVRMETPVLYFHTRESIEIDVRVDFVEGQVTEWYPRARQVGNGIQWGHVLVVPGAHPELPHDGTDSHYYPARAVDSAPVRVCDERGDQWESLLFYRGVGTFALSLSAELDGDEVRTSGAAQGRVLLYERQGERVGVTTAPRTGTLQRPELDDRVEDAEELVRQELVASGLYADEAEAMLETWDDEWFEPGLRIIWVLPREETDARLPLHLDPPPVSSVRTLVGRLELVLPERAEAVRTALSAHDDIDEVVALLTRSEGRFAEPALVHLTNTLEPGAERERALAVLAQIRSQ